MGTDALLLVVGVLVGAINAVAGGGMLIGFPLLLAVGLPPIVANASTKLVIAPGSVAAALGYRHLVRRVPRLYLWILLPTSVLAAVIGAFLLRDTPSSQFERVVPWLLIVSVIAFAFGPYVRRRSRKASLLPMSVVAIVLFGLSLYGGYFGIGYGFMVLALLSFSSLHNMHHMNTVKVLTSVAAAVAGLIVLLPSGLFDWRAGISMGIGCGLGGYVAARHAHKVPEKLIRAFVIAFGLGTAAYLLWTATPHLNLSSLLR